MEAQNKATMEKINKAFETGDVSDVTSLVAAEAIDHSDPNSKQGPEGLKETIQMFRTAFPDLKITTNTIVAEGDMVTCYTTMTGTNTGSFMGQAPTNKQIKVDGVDIVRFKDGKAVERWGVNDSYTMMTQLGMLPPPGSNPAQMAEAPANQAAPEGNSSSGQAETKK
jgi:predicted ester cyclase